MQKIGDITITGTTPLRWKPDPGRRLLRELRENRASKAWAESMVTAPEPGEGFVDYTVRSMLRQKPLRIPIQTVGRTRHRLEDMRRRKTQVVRRGEGKCSGEPQPIDFGDPDAW